MELAKSTIIVTGAARRFGKTVATELARRGASLILHYNTSVDPALRLASELQAENCSILPLQANLTDLDAVRKLFRQAVDAFGQVDAIINSASLFRALPLTELDQAEWDLMHNLHLRAPFFLARELYLHRQEQSWDYPASIINITDSSAHKSVQRRLAYSSAKVALESQTALWATTFAPLVRVNSIAPGYFRGSSNEDKLYSEKLVQRLPLATLVSEAQVLQSVLFVLDNDAITGTVIPVDGGEHLL